MLPMSLAGRRAARVPPEPSAEGTVPAAAQPLWGTDILMTERVEIAKVADYQIDAMRISDRVRTNKSNFLAIGVAIAIMSGLTVYAVVVL